MEFVFFGLIKIATPAPSDVHLINPSRPAKCLVFDFTDISSVCTWIEQNIHKDIDIYRMLIPVHDNAMTYARFLQIYNNQIPVKTLMDWPPRAMFDIVRMHGTTEPNTTDPWPRIEPDDPCSINDLFTTFYHYQRMCLLPHPLTGLSVVQEYVIKSGVTKFKTQVSLACGEFYLRRQTIHDHLLQLSTLNYLVTDTELMPIPLLLCNGSIPYQPTELLQYVKNKASNRIIDFKTDLIPTFKGLRNPYSCTYELGIITRLPYGTKPADYPNHKDCSVWGSTALVGPFIEDVSPPAQIQCFDGTNYLTFDSAEAYFNYWYDLIIKEMIKEVVAFDEKERDRIERKVFIRDIFIVAKETNRFGDWKRFYIDYNKEDKKKILMSKYGHTRWGDIPISEIGPDYETFGVVPIDTTKELTNDEICDIQDRLEAEYEAAQPEYPEFVTARGMLLKHLTKFESKCQRNQQTYVHVGPR